MDDLKIHSLGCPITRTGRCTCTYMAQWTGPGPAHPIHRLGHKGACLEDGGPQECSCHLTDDVICYHRTAGWHRTDHVSCQDWEVLVRNRRRDFGEEFIRVGYGFSDADSTHPKYLLDQAEPKQRSGVEDLLANPEPYLGKLEYQPDGHTGVDYRRCYCQGNEAWAKLLRAQREAAAAEARYWKRSSLIFGITGSVAWLLHAARAFWGF